MSDHLDLDGLADVLAGAPAPSHLETCASCQARLAELTAALPAVDAALAALPVPVPPADLEGRLEAALAGEQPLVTPTVLPTSRHRSSWLPALGAVAAVAVLVTGAVVLSQRHGSTNTSASHAPRYAINTSGTNYTADGKALRAALPSLLAGHATEAPKTLGAAPAPQASQARSLATMTAADPLATLRTTNGLASCLASLTDPSAPGLPLALDYAQFAGQPALVVVLPSAKADKVDVFVVGSGCSQADAKLLLFSRLPKP